MDVVTLFLLAVPVGALLMLLILCSRAYYEFKYRRLVGKPHHPRNTPESALLLFTDAFSESHKNSFFQRYPDARRRLSPELKIFVRRFQVVDRAATIVMVLYIVLIIIVVLVNNLV
jgi:hypothetical protein